MFGGHLALALGAGVTALDLVWPILLLLGVEQVSRRPGATAQLPHPRAGSAALARPLFAVRSRSVELDAGNAGDRGRAVGWRGRSLPPWPPPPSERALAQLALIGWIVLPWAALADRHYRATVG